MNLPQARAWKKFKIGELFDIHPTQAYKLTNRELFATTGNTPVLSNSSENNGIAGYVDLPPTEKGGKITFSDTTTSDAIFYQPTSFVGYPHVQGLYAKHAGVWSEKSLLYFVSLFKAAAFGRFDYAAKFTRIIASAMEVLLPVTDDEEIDFAYMESYVETVEKARVCEVDEYLQSIGLSDSTLSEDEEQSMNEFAADTLRMGLFSTGDLFTVTSNPQLNKESFVFSNDAEFPYFTRTVSDNGILGYVNYFDEGHKIKGRSLAVGMLGMQFFYIGHDYYAGQFTKSIRLKEGELDECTGLFFATLFNKAKGEFQKGLVGDFKGLFSSLKIRLPVTENGKIDYVKMKTLISACMKCSLQGVSGWMG